MEYMEEYSISLMCNALCVSRSGFNKWRGRRLKKCASDITYLYVADCWLYLATLMDLYSGKIACWALANDMTENLANGY